MKTYFALIFAAALAIATPSMARNADALLADQHANAGVKCEACHGAKKPAEGAAVPLAARTKCHGSYEALAEKTRKLDPNPHRTHQGDVRCSDCHRGHQKSVLMCNDCHRFDLKP